MVAGINTFVHQKGLTIPFPLRKPCLIQLFYGSIQRACVVACTGESLGCAVAAYTEDDCGNHRNTKASI